MDVSASALRSFRFDQDKRARHDVFSVEASLSTNVCRFLFYAADFWMRPAGCDNMPRYFGHHVASVRVLFVQGTIVSRTTQI
jgi:hypothetical protein